MALFHIFWREFKTYFLSPVGYFVIIGFLLFNGYIYWLMLSWVGSRPTTPASMDPLTILMSGLIFMITAAGIIPMITMRLFAEEKRTGSIELLLTAPVRDYEVVAGKFLAGWFFYLALWAPTLVYVWACYLGVVMMSFAFVAVGTMFSSFTRSQMLAFGLTFAFLVVLFFLGFAADQVPGRTLREILGYIGVHRYMDDFSRGLIDSRAVVYFLSMGLMALFITVRSIEARKWR